MALEIIVKKYQDTKFSIENVVVTILLTLLIPVGTDIISKWSKMETWELIGSGAAGVGLALLCLLAAYIKSIREDMMVRTAAEIEKERKKMQDDHEDRLLWHEYHTKSMEVAFKVTDARVKEIQERGKLMWVDTMRATAGRISVDLRDFVTRLAAPMGKDGKRFIDAAAGLGKQTGDDILDSIVERVETTMSTLDHYIGASMKTAENALKKIAPDLAIYIETPVPTRESIPVPNRPTAGPVSQEQDITGAAMSELEQMTKDGLVPSETTE